MAPLSEEQVRKFHEDGYLIIENFLDDSEIEGLVNSCRKIVDNMNLEERKCIFTTTDARQANDIYFLESGDKIRYFFESGALDDQGNLLVDRYKALNKIGHALHWLEPNFRKLTFSDKVKDVVRSVGFKDPAVAQSMYIFKQPNIGGEVTPHQDSSFLHTSPLNIMGMWFALEDVTLENGCLWFIPGSHKEGITRRFVRNPDKNSKELLMYTDPPTTYDEKLFVPGNVPKGTCVLIHGEVVHKSERNLSNKSRHIYTFHIMEKENTKYSEDNWLQPTEELPFPGLFDN